MLLIHQPVTSTGIGTATWLELAWFFIGVIGLYNMLLLTLAAAGDYDFIQREGLNGSRKIVARTSVITLGAKLLVLIGYAIIGVVAALTKPIDPDQQITSTGIIITVIFLITSIALNISGVVQRRARNAVLEYEAKRDQDLYHRSLGGESQ